MVPTTHNTLIKMKEDKIPMNYTFSYMSFWHFFDSNSEFSLSFLVCFPLSFVFFDSPTKRAWFLEYYRAPIWISLSCSWIMDSLNGSREGIHQFGVVILLECEVDTKTKKLGPNLLRMDSTSCSSFFSIPHCLHCITKELNLVKNNCMVSKLLGWRTINSSSKMWPLNSSCFVKSDLSFFHTYLGAFNPSRWKSKSLDIWMHIKINYSSNLFRYLKFSRGCWDLTSFPLWPYT